MTIREAVAADADAIGHVHVRAWQSAYRGIMPDPYLDSLQTAERADMWRSVIGRADRPPVLVAALGDVVVGFAAFGIARDADGDPPPGELYAMNLDPEQWGRGIGRALLRVVTGRLADLGYDEAVLWVVPENARARGLYESEGWVADGAVSTEEMLGVTVTDVRYRKRLRSLDP